MPPPQFSAHVSRRISRDNSESTITVLPSTAVFFRGTYRGAQSVGPPNTGSDHARVLATCSTSSLL